MTSHDWFLEHRIAFVIRSLESEEERVFAEHLRGCAECREAVARIERDLAWLPMDVSPAHPRPGLSRALIDGVLGGGRRRYRWAVPLTVAASLLLTIGAWQVEHRRTQAFERQVAGLQHELTGVRDTLDIIRGAARVLQASIQMDGHEGGMTIFADERTHRWNVVVHGLPPALPGQVYQFWFICANGMVRSVEVHPDVRTPAFVTLGMPPEGGAVMGAALTLEPMGGQSPGPKGKELAHLML